MANNAELIKQCEEEHSSGSLLLLTKKHVRKYKQCSMQRTSLLS